MITSLSTNHVQRVARVPVRIVLLVDRSGSMLNTLGKDGRHTKITKVKLIHVCVFFFACKPQLKKKITFDMCTKRGIRSARSLRCPLEEILHLLLSIKWSARILIRLQIL